jgi:hypothetical protein
VRGSRNLRRGNSIRVACLEEPVLNSPPYVVINESALVRAFEVLRSLRDLFGQTGDSTTEKIALPAWCHRPSRCGVESNTVLVALFLSSFRRTCFPSLKTPFDRCTVSKRCTVQPGKFGTANSEVLGALPEIVHASTQLNRRPPRA